MRKSSNKTAVAATPAQLEAKAGDQLSQQNYRDAITTYTPPGPESWKAKACSPKPLLFWSTCLT